MVLLIDLFHKLAVFNMPYSILLRLHLIMVSIFLGLYMVKTILLLTRPDGLYVRFRKVTLVPEIVVSILFLLTGFWMLLNIGEIKNMLLVKLALTGLVIPFAVFAFKKKHKLFSVISFVVLISIYGLAEMSKKVKPHPNHIDSKVLMTSSSYTLSSHGQILYNQYCVNCHGPLGNDQYSGAKRLSISIKSDSGIVSIIKQGKAAMPKYARLFNDDELRALTEFVKVLRLSNPD